MNATVCKFLQYISVMSHQICIISSISYLNVFVANCLNNLVSYHIFTTKSL